MPWSEILIAARLPGQSAYGQLKARGCVLELRSIALRPSLTDAIPFRRSGAELRSAEDTSALTKRKLRSGLVTARASGTSIGRSTHGLTSGGALIPRTSRTAARSSRAAPSGLPLTHPGRLTRRQGMLRRIGPQPLGCLVASEGHSWPAPDSIRPAAVAPRSRQSLNLP